MKELQLEDARSDNMIKTAKTLWQKRNWMSLPPLPTPGGVGALHANGWFFATLLFPLPPAFSTFKLSLILEIVSSACGPSFSRREVGGPPTLMRVHRKSFSPEGDVCFPPKPAARRIHRCCRGQGLRVGITPAGGQSDNASEKL